MRRRILIMTLSVAGAALIVFGVPLGWAVGRVYRSDQLTRLQQAATSAAAAVPGEGLRGADPVEPPPVPRGIALTYYDAVGKVAVGPGPAVPDAHVGEALAGRPVAGRSGGRLVAAVPIAAKEATIGAVEATSSSGAVSSRVHRTWLGMLGLGAVALAAAGGVAARQTRRVVAPLDDLVDVAARLGEGEFTQAGASSGVPEVDRARRALDATSARLGELMDRERAFTAHASHQLRTPLTALRLTLEAAIETPGGDLRGAVADAIGEVDRLQATLEELFALARTGTTPEQRIPLADILGSIEQRWHAPLARDGRRLHVRSDGGDDDPAAPATLSQVLDVLIDNAALHGRGTVSVTAAPTAGGISIDVEDEGDGLDGTDGNDGPHRADHGFGLPLARSLTEAAGGRLVIKRRGPRPIIAVVLPRADTGPASSTP